MYQAVYALAWLKAHNGSYRGNIVEIQGLIGASPNTDEYVGIRSVLRHYPDVKIIGTGEGKYAQNEGRKVMEGYLERFKPGEIDLVICYSDSEALGALEAIEASGRNELLEGRLLGKDQMVSFVEEIIDGRALMTTECSPFYGPFTIPTAIRYLNGDEIPEMVQYLPLRCWENPTDDIDLTPAENDMEIYKRHIAYAKERDLALIPPETGDYDELHVDLRGIKGYEEVLTYSRTKVVPSEIVDLQNA
jgi:ABC-type sugar transport system substrate-binding protein